MHQEEWLFGHFVTLPEMLDGREKRARSQQEMLKRCCDTVQQEVLKKQSAGGSHTLVCFTLNIAGPIKVFPLAEESFEEGVRQIREVLKDGGFSLIEENILRASYGWEAYFVVEGGCREIKEKLTILEEQHPLGRLFDIDVLNEKGEKASRQEIGYPARTCLICGKMAAECARSRTHSVPELQERTVGMMLDFWRGKKLSPAFVGRLCRQALLREVYTTPKPGLVDLRNTGAHRDMDVALFETSAGAIESYFAACYQEGLNHCGQPEDLFSCLRTLGVQAEKDMFSATGGVNTHKGMIFSLGIICGALGILSAKKGFADVEELLMLAGRIAVPAFDADLRPLQREEEIMSPAEKQDPEAANGKRNLSTAGEKQYLRYGITGIRGEAASGFASIRKCAWPFFQSMREQGESSERAGMLTLLKLITEVTDTNMIARAGLETQQRLQKQVRELLEQDSLPTTEEIEALDDTFIRENVSPGGCADLLAIVYFLQQLMILCILGNL